MRAWCLLALVACAEEPRVVLSPEGAASLLLLRQTEALSLHAYQLPLAEPSLRLEFPEGGRTTALFYQRSLEELLLRPGPLAALPEGEHLPLADRALFTVDGLSWGTVEPAASDGAGLRVDRRPCFRFILDDYTIPGAGAPAFGLVLPSARVLLFLYSGRTFWLTRTGPATGPELPLGFAPVAGWAGPGEQLWLFDRAGRLYSGPPEALRPVAELAGKGTPLALSGGLAGGVLELYALTSSGSLYRFDGQRFEARFEDTRRLEMGRVAWIGPGRARAAGHAQVVMLEDRAGRAGPVPVEGLDLDTLPDNLNLLFHSARWGTLLGTAHGRLLRRTDSGFELLARSPAEGNTFVISELAESLFYGGDDSVVVQLHPERLCEPFFVGQRTDRPLRELLPEGGALLAVPRDPEPGGLRISVLAPQPRVTE